MTRKPEGLHVRPLKLGLLGVAMATAVGLVLPTGHEAGIGVPAPRTIDPAASSWLPSPTELPEAQLEAVTVEASGSLSRSASASATRSRSRSATARQTAATAQAAATQAATAQAAATQAGTAQAAPGTSPAGTVAAAGDSPSRQSRSTTEDRTSEAGAPLPGNWKVAFFEDFNADLNPEVWAKLRGAGDGTYAAPYSVSYDAYAYKESYTTVENGNLRLRWAPDPVTDGGHHFPYTAAVATTANGYHFKYGIVEARIWLPSDGPGLWPCFWLLPYPVDSAWPPEIDIAEFDYNNNTVTGHGNVHYLRDGQKKDIPGFPPYAPNVGGQWHTYGVRWAPDRLEFMLDGKVAYTYTGDGIPQQDMYIVLSTGVLRGYNPGANHMLVDYVRVWQEA